MYTLSPITLRVGRIKKRCRDTKPKICIERFKIVTDYYIKNPSKPGILKRAEVFKELCEKMPTPVFDDEVIVGSLTKMYRGSALFPEYSSAFLFDELLLLRDTSFDEAFFTIFTSFEFGISIFFSFLLSIELEVELFVMVLFFNSSELSFSELLIEVGSTLLMGAISTIFPGESIWVLSFFILSVKSG